MESNLSIIIPITILIVSIFSFFYSEKINRNYENVIILDLIEYLEERKSTIKYCCTISEAAAITLRMYDYDEFVTDILPKIRKFLYSKKNIEKYKPLPENSKTFFLCDEAGLDMRIRLLKDFVDR